MSKDEITYTDVISGNLHHDHNGYHHMVIDDDGNEVVGPTVKCLTYAEYGSQVYKTTHENSDHDWLSIVDGEDIEIEYQKCPHYLDQGQTPSAHHDKQYSVDVFQRKLNEYEMVVLECYFWMLLNKKTAGLELTWELELPKLRHAISHKASHSFVKAKKKMTVERDKFHQSEWEYHREVFRGKKSLFHSLRIIRFGIQIATSGSITDFEECKELYHEIMDNPGKDWEDYRPTYKPLYNRYMSEFRELAPKS